MDSYTSMVKKLTDTKLYSVRTGGRTYAELKAFAAGLDLLFNELDEMLKEYFIDTAQSYGLTERERFTGAVRDDLSIEKRRELLKIREQTNEEFCTPGVLIRFWRDTDSVILKSPKIRPKML
mgnify:CR=1 FL=1